MATWKLTGMDDGKHVVHFIESGEIHKLTDEEFAALQGGKAIRQLEKAKQSAGFEKELKAALARVEELEAAAEPLRAEAKAKDDEIEALKKEVKSLGAKVKELEAALKNAGKKEPKKPVRAKAETK